MNMENLLHVGAWLLSAQLSAVLVYLAVELSVGLVSAAGHRSARSKVNLNGVILVPAHNEALGIAETVIALRTAAPNYRIVVIADNCTDETASLAQSAGAEAIIRSDISQKGKGFALSFGRDYLAKAPPDAVIVIDADCRLSQGSADILVARAVQGSCPVQGVNLLVAGSAISPLASISNFAMLVKNLVRARGLARIAGGTLLFGTGMAFPWSLFQRLDLATSDMVEDLQLGLSLARQGIKIGFEDRALVTSPAASDSDSKGQRSRWEHGFLQTAIRNAIPLFLLGIRHRSRHLLIISIHMMVPPLAMLMILSLIAVLLLTFFWFFSGVNGPLFPLVMCLALVTLLLLAAWLMEGRKVLSGKSLLMVPIYILWKVPIYVRFFTNRQMGWNRTQRDGEQP